MNSKVFFIYRNDADYPKFDFNPSKLYPEYPFGCEEISMEKNDAYDMVRDCLAKMNLDKQNYGTKKWNPLGDFIKLSDFVLVKPNLVMHINENRDVQTNALECLITHPACIRAICDYCIIALKGTGRLMIGDAPMQGCDFAHLLRNSKLQMLIDFYLAHGINVELKDFRQYQSVFNHNKVIVKKQMNSAEGTTVHLSNKSQHYKSGSNGKYQVSDYAKEDTLKFHHDETHDYVIINEVLHADVVINFCKPKTHRLAGITAAMKNMVGITYNKACLPHRSAGSKKENGDAYLHTSVLKKIADAALTKKIHAENKHCFWYATLLRYIYGVTLVMARVIGKDPYYIGSWYGNDTIWRTICDLNYIICYADKKGVLKNSQQRTIFNIGDMIVSGQRNGPVSPQPKPFGAIVASFDAAAMDIAIAKCMGFDYHKIPLLKNIAEQKSWIEYQAPEIHSNDQSLSGQLDEIKFPSKFSFIPHDAWKGKIEISR